MAAAKIYLRGVMAAGAAEDVLLAANKILLKAQHLLHKAGFRATKARNKLNGVYKRASS